jgi:hypothetical protein
MGKLKEYGSGTISTSLVATDAAIAKIPKSDSNVSWNATALAAILTQVNAGNSALDTQIRIAASGSKTISNGVTKWLSIDSGTNGAEILSIIINGVVSDIWTLDIYVPAADAVADTAAGDKRATIAYAAIDTEGGMISGFAIPFNCFLDFTNGGVDSDAIAQVQVVYKSRAALTLAWEA